jgi:two-component sensor histidine kinase
MKKPEDQIKELNVELNKAKLELTRVEKNRRAFIGHLSHELRTPLTSIIESLSLVLDGTLGKINKEQEEFLALARGEAKRLARLVKGLLDIARIHKGAMEIRKRPISIHFIVDEVRKEMQAEANKKRISLKSDLPPHLPAAYADHDKITQILTNIMNNAIKFTSEEGKISVRGEEEDEYIKVTVADTGCGIASENLDKIFGEFSSSNPSTGAPSGTGLGLAIAKELIELQGGKINVESKLGEGSNFTFAILKYGIPLFSAEHLNDEIERAKDTEKKQEFKKPVIMLSVVKASNLKEIYSGEERERTLRELKNVLNGIIRYPYDLVSEYGDNGVVIIFNEVDKDKMSAIEDRVNGAIKEHKFAGNLDIRKGKVIYPDDGSSGQELLRKIEEITEGHSG